MLPINADYIFSANFNSCFSLLFTLQHKWLKWHILCIPEIINTELINSYISDIRTFLCENTIVIHGPLTPYSTWN